MENNHIENIIKDLYTLDATLMEQDEEVRALVLAMVSAKPTVAVDQTFVANLRRALVKPAPIPSASLHHSLNWWMFRLTPVGALAILIIMFVPSLMSPTIPPVEEALFTSEVALDTFEAPSAKREADIPPESTSLMMVTNDAPTSDSFTVSEQEPGDTVIVDFVSLTTPGFVIIQKNTEGELGEIIGTSTLLQGGLTEHVRVPLTTTTLRGETYFAVLYTDDGDGVYAKGVDSPVYDASGITPLFVLFSIAENTLP